jgi:hypothetical protein
MNTQTTATLNVRTARALRAAALHLLISILVASVVAMLVFAAWFPSPFRELAGGAELFCLIVGVDIVCGPLLTLVVFNPAKPRAELLRDLTLVAGIQLLALGYGVHTLSYARPLALVHEVDRFRVVSFADLDEADLSTAPGWVRPWGLSAPRIMGIRPAVSGEEKLASVEASLQGVEPSQRPSWWQDYALSVPQVLAHARSLAELRAKHSAHAARLNRAATEAAANVRDSETIDPAALRWLPLVSRRAMDWVVLLDPSTGRVRGYVHLDGF